MKKIAILGCENAHAALFLRFIDEHYKYRDIEVVGVFSEDVAAAEKLNKAYGVYVMKSYDELVGKVDAIINTARHGDNHYKYCAPYIKDGIPMFIDKPVTISEEEAVKFMQEAKANGVKITGGSCVKHEVAVQQIKRDVINKEDGETLGGVVRGPLSSNTPNGGFFFYVQHLVESVMEAFGRYPKSVQTFKTGGKDFVKGDALTIVFRYDNYDIIGVAEELGGSYYISRHSTYHVKGYEMMVTFDNPCFLKEFDEFHDIVKGADQRITYEDFIAPVFVMNAIKRSIDTGKECEVKTFEI